MSHWQYVGVRGRWEDLSWNSVLNSPEAFGEVVGKTPSGNVKVKVPGRKGFMYFREVRA